MRGIHPNTTVTNYPFGMLMPGRTYTSEAYNYGFNGKEKDDEVSNQGNCYDYGFRIYNSRIGKFLSVDPLFKSYAWYTPYQFAGNIPIAAIDLDGLEEFVVVRWYDNNKLSHFTIMEVPTEERNKAVGLGTLYIELDNTPENINLYKTFFTNNNDPNAQQLDPIFSNANIDWSVAIDKVNGTFNIGSYELESRNLEKNYWTRKNIHNKTSTGVRIKLKSRFTILFENNESVLTDDDKETLENVNLWLSLDEKIVTNLEGNTDRDASKEYNKRLSQKRINSVKSFLSELLVTNQIMEKNNGEKNANQDVKASGDRNVTITLDYPEKGQ